MYLEREIRTEQGLKYWIGSVILSRIETLKVHVLDLKVKYNRVL